MRGTMIFALPLVLFLAMIRVDAQVTTASISGIISDSTGAVIPGIEATATQQETRFMRTAVADETGHYRIEFLPLGIYRIDVTTPGFKKFSQAGIVLDVNRNARVDAVLEVGGVAEEVSITADAPRVNTSDASIGSTVSNREIVSLPLVNRDLYTLLTLTPGVDQSDASNPLGSPAQISVVNGSSSGTGSITYYLDGGNNTAGLRNTGNSLPSPDAVQEFRVITNSYSAEFGRFAGGMVDVVTKSGSNNIHGSLFEFFRNDALNANSWNASSKPALHRNQFGGSLGGPLVKNRTFLFGSYSGLRQRKDDFSNTAVVPTAAERLGDFSVSRVKPNDPVTRLPFDGGIIPGYRLDPPALINQLRLTYVRNFGGRINSPAKSLADFGSKFRVQGVPALPDIDVTGYFRLAQSIAGPVAGSNYYGLRELLSWNKRHHVLRVGTELSLEKNIHDALLNNYGTFSFDGSKTGNALADFMMGLPRSMNQDAPITKYNNGWYYAAFVQDDFRVHPRLTLNLGLRYDVQTPFTDPLDRQLTFVQGVKSTRVPSAPAGLLFPGDPGVTRGIVKTDVNNFAPRVGLAWDPMGDGKTSVRAAAGMFFGSVSANEWNQSTDFQPFSARQQYTNVKSLTDPYGNFPGGVSPYPYIYSPANPKLLPDAAVTGIALDFRWPYTYQLNFSIQRQVTSDLS